MVVVGGGGEVRAVVLRWRARGERGERSRSGGAGGGMSELRLTSARVSRG